MQRRSMEPSLNDPHRVSALFATGVLLMSLSAKATAESLPDCTQDNICSEMYERAKSESVQGRHGEAARLYKLAYQIKSDPRILFNIARMLHKDGQPNEARAYYQQFVRSLLDDPAQKKKAEEYLSQLPPEQEPAQVSIQQSPSVPTASVSVATPTPSSSPAVPTATHRFPRTAVILLAGGGAALLSGLILGGSALAAQNQVISGNGPFDADLYDRGVAMNRAAITLDVIGGTLLSAGTIWSSLWLVQKRRATQPVEPIQAEGQP